MHDVQFRRNLYARVRCIVRVTAVSVRGLESLRYTKKECAGSFTLAAELCYGPRDKALPIRWAPSVPSERPKVFSGHCAPSKVSLRISFRDFNVRLLFKHLSVRLSFRHLNVRLLLKHLARC